MSRSVGGLAWVVATVLSVAASTAAVATVRDQVTDGPEVVSLATLRRATSTTRVDLESGADIPTPKPTSAAPTTTTTAVPPTTRPNPTATPGTTVEIAEPLAEEVPETPPPSDAPATNGDVITRSLRGGSVSISFDGSTIRLIEAVPEDPYDVSIETRTDRMIVVRFILEGRSTAFIADVARGRLRIKTFD